MKTDIYTLAHEVKNPLCVVKGYLEMMNKENFIQYKKIIDEEIKTSLEILDNYLEFNKLQLVKEEMDLNVLLNDIRNNMTDYLKKNSINLTIDFQDDDIYLEADYNKLKQVFYNIIKNSIESQSHNINISYKILFGKITICIANDGLMIDENCLYKIGSMYSNKINGNGIGTSLSKKIIELHHGKLKYKNNKTKGVSVYITLNLS